MTPLDQVEANSPKITRSSAWSRRYGARHRLVWVLAFPAGVAPPRKVRVYRRVDHFVLQWWDPGAQQNLSDRVDGDLVDALARARAIDERLRELRRSGRTRRRLTHDEMADAFLADLQRRADAGAISIATVARYRAVLQHYRVYVNQPDVFRRYRLVSRVDREFSLAFAAFLRIRRVARNGRSNAPQRRMQAVDFVLDTVRAMFAWVIDPNRGGLLPGDFGNPFLRSVVGRGRKTDDMLSEPEITIEMAAEFLDACDDYQLRLFAPIICYGLRANEAVFLFHELLDRDSLKVACVEDLDYVTKGRRDKRLPLLESIADLLGAGHNQHGLIYVRRTREGGAPAPLLGASLVELVDEYARRLQRSRATTAGDRLRIRDVVLRDAGALSYETIAGEFRRLVRQLGWSRDATLKDFRHLFATAMTNGRMLEHERRYLMGHAPGKGAIAAYTHMNRLQQHYRNAAFQEMAPILRILESRSRRADPSD